MAWYRSSIYPLAIVLAVAFIQIVSFYVPGTALDDAASTLNRWALIMGVVMIWIGAINIFRHDFRSITRKESGRWHLAIYQLFLIGVMLLSGFGETLAQGASVYWTTPNWATQSGPRAPATVINWLWNNIGIIGEQGVSALTGLWAMTAVYRAFRARTIESGLFLIGAAFVMLRNAPVGGLIWSGFPLIGSWILDVIYNPVVRALVLVLGVGVFTYAVRFFIGKEKAAWGAVD